MSPTSAMAATDRSFFGDQALLVGQPRTTLGSEGISLHARAYFGAVGIEDKALLVGIAHLGLLFLARDSCVRELLLSSLLLNVREYVTSSLLRCRTGPCPPTAAPRARVLCRPSAIMTHGSLLPVWLHGQGLSLLLRCCNDTQVLDLPDMDPCTSV